MDNFISAAPYANLTGIQDTTRIPPVLNAETLPQHLPHVYTLAATGPTLPQLVDTSSLAALYDASTFDLRGPYCTHQTALINTIAEAGGSMLVQRVLPDDAPAPAALGLYLDLVAEPALPQYQRNTDGTYKLDADGKKQAVVGAGSTAAGILARWVVKPVAGDAIGTAEVVAGSIQASDSTQSQLYPILEFPTSFAGSLGNNLGVAIWAPTTDSSPGFNAAASALYKTFIYRLQFMKRANALASPMVIQTLQGEQSVEFSFASGVIDPVTDKVLSYGDSVIPAWQSLDEPGKPPQYGPFSKMYVYEANLNTVLNQIFAAEQPAGLLGDATVKPHLVNLFGATDPNGVPYYNFTLQGPADGGLLFAEGVPQYAAGGGDGTLSFAKFDAAVQDELLNYGAKEAHLLDTAMYPQSVIYDSGFTLATKKAMATVLGLRKDIALIVSTQDVSQAQNDGSAETSIATALRTTFNNYPESTLYGTPVCRAVIVGQSGYLINSQYTGLLPLTLEYAKKAITYMGAGNGIWREGFAFDRAPLNQITMFKGVNGTYKPALARNNDWQIGLNWAQNFDRRSLFWSAMQTVYPDDSSVLNSAITMHACVELEKVCDRVWRELTGDSSLTDDQFIERSNKLIAAKTTNRFDGRFIIKADTYFTAQDKASGKSWSCKITIYAPSMKTVGTYTVVAARKDSLSSATGQ